MGILGDARACEAYWLYYLCTLAADYSLTRFAAHKRHYTALSESVHGPHEMCGP
jgi:hypothetical protein